MFFLRPSCFISLVLTDHGHLKLALGQVYLTLDHVLKYLESAASFFKLVNGLKSTAATKQVCMFPDESVILLL